MARRSAQLKLFDRPKRRGRAKPGPKPRPERIGFVPHVTRPVHEGRHPVHVTIRRVALAPSFRTERVHRAIVALFLALKARGVRVIHYSIQPDHLHLMVESTDRHTLSRQMQLLFSRIAMRVNRIAHRRGALFRDRHHRHELRTPTETRRALVYILFNDRKHAAGRSWVAQWRDGFSSAPWFTNWDPTSLPPEERASRGDLCPVSTPATWLAQKGWLRAGGLLRFDERPASRI